MDSDFFIPGGLFEDDESMQSMSGINPGAREFRPTEPEPHLRTRAGSAQLSPCGLCCTGEGAAHRLVARRCHCSTVLQTHS